MITRQFGPLKICSYCDRHPPSRKAIVIQHLQPLIFSHSNSVPVNRNLQSETNGILIWTRIIGFRAHKMPWAIIYRRFERTPPPRCRAQDSTNRFESRAATRQRHVFRRVTIERRHLYSHSMPRKILCVAEKPSIAKAVSGHMSGGRIDVHTLFSRISL